MTKFEFDTEILTTYTGRIMRKLDASAFKIVICLGPTKDGRKLRVCVWSDNKRKWSKPQTRETRQLDAIDLDAITAGQRRAVGHAINDVGSSKVGQDGWCRWDGGAQSIGKPWINKSAPTKAPTAGVTKLASESFSATPEGRSKLQKLNQTLGNWMFGGRK
jgi:hypothetical protein